MRMIIEASDLKNNMVRLDKGIKKFTAKGTLDPTILALMKAQYEHMCAYMNTLLLRCEMLFAQDEIYKLYNILDNDTKKDKTNN